MAKRKGFKMDIVTEKQIRLEVNVAKQVSQGYAEFRCTGKAMWKARILPATSQHRLSPADSPSVPIICSDRDMSSFSEILKSLAKAESI